MARPIRTVLAANDFSRAADAALARATRLAREQGARLVLLHVIGRDVARYFRPGLAGLDRRLRAEIARRLKEAAAAIRRSHGLRVTALLERGATAERIARAARRARADLIVLGAHGRHTLLDNVLGTTTQRVLRLAAAPVLVVRAPAAAPYRRILLPCDDSPSARAALRFACAALPDAQCTLVSVANVPFEGFLTRGGVDADALARHRARVEEQTRTRLAALVRESGDPRRFSIRVPRGYVPAQVLRLVEGMDDGLIAMGAYGHAPLAAALLGSVSAHVAAEAPCDVLLVKARAVRPGRRRR